MPTPRLYLRASLCKAFPGIPTPEQGLRQANAASQKLVAKQQHDLDAESEAQQKQAQQASEHAAAEADRTFAAKVRTDDARLESLRRALDVLDDD